MTEDRNVVVVLFSALVGLGLLIGTLLAMSAQSLAQAVIAAVFTLFGGSLLVFLRELTPRDQIKVASGVLAISLGTLGGVYSGLYANEHQILTPPSLRVTKDATEAGVVNKYLKANLVPTTVAIDQKYRAALASASNELAKLKAAKDAYEELQQFLDTRSAQEPREPK